MKREMKAKILSKISSWILHIIAIILTIFTIIRLIRRFLG
jgi:hypothetical protein